MASKSIIAKHHKIRQLVNKFKSKREELKRKIKDPSIDINTKIKHISALNKIDKNSSSVRLYPICNITGRTKGMIFYKRFGLSRQMLRDLIVRGCIPGVKKLN